MSTRQYGKSILQGLGFGKLEQAMYANIVNGKFDSVMVSTPTSRATDDALDAMLNVMNVTVTGRSGNAMWKDDYYISPEPHCKKRVFDIIDKFWAYPEKGDVYLYLEQLRKNPVTKELFKGESTTHHYPWYKRGTKY